MYGQSFVYVDRRTHYTTLYLSHLQIKNTSNHLQETQFSSILSVKVSMFTLLSTEYSDLPNSNPLTFPFKEALFMHYSRSKVTFCGTLVQEEEK